MMEWRPSWYRLQGPKLYLQPQTNTSERVPYVDRALFYLMLIILFFSCRVFFLFVFLSFVRLWNLDSPKLLSRDLRRVTDDAFALEQRLDQALDEEHANQEAFKEAEQLQQDAQRVPDEEEGLWEEEVDRQESRSADANREEKGARGNDPASLAGSDTADPRQVAEPWGGEQAEGSFEDRGMGFSGYDAALDGEGAVDFVGEDEEDNVWQ